MFGKISNGAGIALLLIFIANGCGDSRNVVSPSPPGTKFVSKLFDIYDPSMMFGSPIIPRSYGEGTFILSEDGSVLSFDVSFRFFSEGEFGRARFYISPMYPSGQTVRTMQLSEISGNWIRGAWRNTDSEPLTQALVDSLIAGSIFIEVVAKDSTGLDIGQLLPAP